MDIENPIFINNNNNNNPIAIPVAHVIAVEVASVRVDYVDVDDEQIIEPRQESERKNIYARCYLYVNIATILSIGMSVITGMLLFLIWLNEPDMFN